MDTTYEIAKYSTSELAQVAREIPHQVRDECYARNEKIAKKIRRLEAQLEALHAENAELAVVLKLACKAI